MKYRVPEPTRFERETSVFGHLEYEWPAGDVTPADEAEAHALEKLAEQGLAEVIDAPTRSKRKDGE